MSYASAENPYLAPYWAGVRDGELRLQQCTRCLHKHFPPVAVCPECLDDNQHFIKASGKGRVLSAITFHQQYWPDRPPPYDVLLIALEEGPLMMSQTVPGHAVPSIGDMVEVIYETSPDGTVTPQFVHP